MWRTGFILLLILLTACGGASVAQPASPAGQAQGPAPTALPSPSSPSADKTPLPSPHACNNPIPDDVTFGILRWPNTDFCTHSVPYEEILGLLGRDSLLALDNPAHETYDQADVWLTAAEPVIVVAQQGEAIAYPLSILLWHEIVNDTVGGRPLAITYCPLCNSALVFDRTLDGRLLDFGVSGNIRNADLVMYDRQTESWWQQFTGEAIVGELTGRRLELVASAIVGYEDFKTQFPDGRVLSIATGLDQPYGENPYPYYDSLTHSRTKFYDGEADGRKPAKLRVLAVKRDGEAVAYPYDLLEVERVINDDVAGQPVVVFWKGGTISPLYKDLTFDGRPVGSARGFSRLLEGQVLTFEALPEGDFTDQQTGSRWNLFGTAVEGPLAGSHLEPLPAHELFWFAWAAFEPGTRLYAGVEESAD